MQLWGYLKPTVGHTAVPLDAAHAQVHTEECQCWLAKDMLQSFLGALFTNSRDLPVDGSNKPVKELGIQVLGQSISGD